MATCVPLQVQLCGNNEPMCLVLDGLSNLASERVGLICFHLDVVVSVKRPVLLLVERNARWQRGEVPVHVPIRQLAPETQDVQTLRRCYLSDCLPYAVNDTLHLQVLFLSEVSGHMLAMLLGGHEHIPIQRRVFAQEGNCVAILVDNMVEVLGISCDKLTDEADTRELVPYLVMVDA